MRIRCAIFDFDGTLFDSMQAWLTAGEVYLRSRGKTPGPTVSADLRSLSLYQSACYLRREYALSDPLEAIMDGINGTVEQAYLHRVLPKPGVPAFLDRLRRQGTALCIATATDRYLIDAALSRCGMERDFDGIFTCGEVGHGKDEPVIFRRAMERFGAGRENTVIFEDSLYAARTARKDGFTVAAVYDPSEKGQEELRGLADVFIEDFEHPEGFWRFKDERE